MNGVPTHEIMAQSGHKTTQMIDRYTKLTNIKETSAAKKNYKLIKCNCCCN